VTTLLDAPEGSRVVVREVLSPGQGVIRRLLEMGLVPGTELEVVRNRWGPVIVRVRGYTVAVGRGLARKVLVEVVG